MDRAYRIEFIKYSVWFFIALAISLWFSFFEGRRDEENEQEPISVTP